MVRTCILIAIVALAMVAGAHKARAEHVTRAEAPKGFTVAPASRTKRVVKRVVQVATVDENGNGE